MTCIKTGARVLFLNYGSVVPADLFQVAGATIVRATTNPAQESVFEEGDATHTIESPPGGGSDFWRKDLGVFAVPSEYVKEL